MPSDIYIGTLLKTLISSRPNGRFLELGTGIGLSLSWMVDGMDTESHLITVDNDPELIDIAKDYFDEDDRLEIMCQDGSEWTKGYNGEAFDLIFADAWPGKYSEIDDLLELVIGQNRWILCYRRYDHSIQLAQRPSRTCG